MKRSAPSGSSSRPTKKLITDYFTPINASKDPVRWLKPEGTLLHGTTRADIDASQSIETSPWACFDLDGTLITTRGKHIFPKNENDWQWLFPSVVEQLRNLHQSGFKIIIFTNQNKLLHSGRDECFKRKISILARRLEIDFDILVATTEDRYRKPCSGMFDFSLSHFGKDSIDKNRSFYVGDAAGRPKAKGRSGDFSDSDLKFALNSDLRFYTPEQYFKSIKEELTFNFEFHPKSVVSEGPIHEPADTPLVSERQELLVLSGYPASGKSTFAERHLMRHDYVRISSETHKSHEMRVAAAKDAIRSGKSVVFDGINLDRASRSPYVALKEELGVQARCFSMNVDHTFARHMDVFRSIIHGRQRLPRQTLIKLKSLFQDVTAEEGFDEIKRINFVPQFEEPEHERIFYQYLY